MTGRRILLGARCFADAEPAIPIAVDLAIRTGATLHGIFAEDRAMLDLCGTMATLVSPNGERLAFDRGAMERACLGDARAFERALARVAGAARVDWTFASGRGSIPALLQRAARQGDLLLHGYRSPFPARDRIIVVTDGTEGTEALIRLSVAMAEGTGKPLHVIITGGQYPAALDPASGASVETVDTLEAACDALQRRSPVTVVVALAPEAGTALAALADASRTTLISVAP